MRIPLRSASHPRVYRIRGRGAAQLLLDAGFSPGASLRHQDVYMSRPGSDLLGALRLRRRMPEGNWSLVWETTPHADDRSRQDLATPVDGQAMRARLERMGFAASPPLTSTRTPFRKGVIAIALEQVAGAGEFLEVPPESAALASGHLTAILERLGAVAVAHLPSPAPHVRPGRPSGQPVPDADGWA